ncbi:hypothetical protein JOC77_000152 [Peribacillus deserti]|uniref:SbsA Ig-like domain-containing protein n=1 Tax=Peribacillus deserti TaxID=673318 RepID=A0ABS2QD64_9BACI|nr:Ig-like domain-containing protein [Peribacillus deserti]MBM7690749.1 hypothetical protein [Peribacillus deserti]
MSKKKAIKLATATAIAASAFAAVAPVQSEAATSKLNEVVQKYEASAKAAYTAYSSMPVGKLASGTEIYKKIVQAEKDRKAAVDFINAGKGYDTKYKNGALAKVTAADVYVNRAKAYNKALGDTQAVQKVAKDALANPTDAKLAAALELLKDSKNYAFVSISKIYGKTARENVFNGFSAGNAKLIAALEAAQTPKVQSVSAINLKQVVVTFSKDVDADLADVKTNYSLTGGLTVASAKSEGKKVVLTLTAAAAQQANVELTVENLKDKSGKAIDKTTKEVKFFDATAPTTTSVEATGPRTLKVKFSEPLKTAPSVKLDNGTLAVVGITWNEGDSEATLTLGTDLSEGSHSLEVSGGTDFANFGIEKATSTINYVKDITAPTVTVKSASETQVVLQFSEDVLNAKDGNVEFYHTFKTGSYKATDVAVDGKEVTLTFAAPLPQGNAKVIIAYASENGAKLQDASGNKVAAQELTGNVVADTVAPTVTKVESKSNTQTNVTFSEAVKSSTVTNTANYSVKDAAGNSVGVTKVELVSGNTYAITTPVLNGGSYTLAIKNVTDNSIRENKMADFSSTVSVNDSVRPEVVGAKKLSDTKLKLTFSEVMDAASATTKSNYQYNSAALATDDKVELTDSNKAVIITIAAGVDDTKGLTVGHVKDAAGNFIEKFETAVDIEALSTIAASSVEATGKNSILLTFDEVITNATTKDFQYTLDETALPAVAWKEPSQISTSVTGGKTYITLTTENNVDTTAAKLAVRTVDKDGKAGATVGAQNSFGTKVVVADSVIVADKYAPTLVGATIADTTAVPNAKYDTVTLTFSEAMYVASVQESDFTVEGYEVTGVSTSGSTVTLTVKENDANLAKPTVKVVGEVQDSARNATKSTQEFVVTGDTPEVK